MAINFPGDWKKKNEDICTYLKENAKVIHFNIFEEYIDRLDEVITQETAEMFNSRVPSCGSACSERFTRAGMEDECFIRFMKEFKDRAAWQEGGRRFLR